MLKAARWAVVGLLATSILTLSFAFGYVARGDKTSKAAVVPSPATSGDASAGKAPGDTDFKNLNDIYKLLQSKYVDRIWSTGRRSTRPPSTACCNRSRTAARSMSIRLLSRPAWGRPGKFEGIGATVAAQNGQIVIVAPIENTPAERAGLKPGDAILEVDGESTEGWTQEKAVIKIRGPRGTTVKLKIRHEKRRRLRSSATRSRSRA